MNNTSIPQQDPLPFPLFNQRFFSEFSQDSKLIGHLNQLMLHLNHKCSYKWINQPKSEWPLDNDLKILVITWNMHGMIPGYSLKRLFNIEQIHHDLIVIGTQECSRSIAVSLLCESKGSWESKLKEELGKNYVKVQSATLNAMHLIVFAHVLLVPKIKNGRPYTLSQGFMGIVGNKGGIGISVIYFFKLFLFHSIYLTFIKSQFKLLLIDQKQNLIKQSNQQQKIIFLYFNINDKIFLFANSHLESGQNAEAKRQTQFSKLETHFENEVFSSHKNVPYDYLIWTGDFNSRIDQKITTQTIRNHSDFFGWLSNDQMYQSRNHSLNYQSYFYEGMIFFPPTYKLLEYQNQWAIGNDFRIPGWCDRILFKENKQSKTGSTTQGFNENVPLQIKLQNYDANFEILGSDHRPVFAQFTVSFQ